MHVNMHICMNIYTGEYVQSLSRHQVFSEIRKCRLRDLRLALLTSLKLFLIKQIAGKSKQIATIYWWKKVCRLRLRKVSIVELYIRD